MDAITHARHIVTKLNRHGHVAYFAGGWVRDFVMQHPSADIDIATDAAPEKILDLFPHTILVGLAFAVVIVVIEGHQFEVSTFRKDLRYEDGRKPVGISLCGPEEDALRRDFTINGMFYDALEERIIDYVGGQIDIEKGVIRAIGDPYARFNEDRLRMIRAVRFASRFGFHIDPETEEGIKANAESLFPAVAMERVWQEFNKMIAFPNFDEALIEMHRLGLLATIFPGLEHLHLHDLKNRVASFVHFPSPCPTILYLMELFPQADWEEQREICQLLRVSGEEIRLVEYVHRLRQACSHENLPQDLPKWAHLYAHPFSQTGLEVIAARLPPSQREAFLELQTARRHALSPHVARIAEKKPLLNANLLITKGIVPGKEMGMLLKEGERLAIEHNLDKAEDVLTHLHKAGLWKER